MKKKYLFYITVISVLGMTLPSCSSSNEEAGMKEYVKMNAPQVKIQLTDEQRVFVNDNNTFSFNFLKTVNETDRSGKSFIYSPLSITFVLGMVNDASTGITKQELEQTLGFHKGGAQAVNEYCKNLIDNLPRADEKVELNIANAIFMNNRYTVKPEFQQDMRQYYNATAEALDFSSLKTLDHINGWCNKQTKGLIPTIIDDINSNMVTFLLNAIYFKADWTSQFDEKNTRTETFTTEAGKVKEVPMMYQDVLIWYMRNDTYSALKIPYGNELWSMTVMLPEEGKSTDDIIDLLAEIGMDYPYYQYEGNDEEMLKNDIYYECKVNLGIPRFETSSDTDELPDNGLISLLQKMGINRVFDADSAEIPNMANEPVSISKMRQKAKIEVNEKGTEMTTVTVAGALASANFRYYPPADFHANRPFVYVISERSSGAILAVGKYTGE